MFLHFSSLLLVGERPKPGPVSQILAHIAERISPPPRHPSREPTQTELHRDFGGRGSILYRQENPAASPVQVENWLVGRLDPFSSSRQPNALGRLNVKWP